MHLFSKAVGLEAITSRPAMSTILNEIVNDAIENDKIIYNPEDQNLQDGFYEAQINKSLLKDSSDPLLDRGGITIRGLYHPGEKIFTQLFYFPYVNGQQPQFNIDVIVERQTDKEAYMVHCNEPKREISPIFFLKNILVYLTKSKGQKKLEEKWVLLSGLSTEGKIILPVKKTDAEIEHCIAARNLRNELVDKALKGDQEAIDDLTLEDYDTIASICKRIRHEDVYTIVDSTMVPAGMECDMYSVVGNILMVDLMKNELTGEEVYYLGLECNDVYFDLAINKESLFGLPIVGCRFIGKVWLQGDLCYENNLTN